MRSTLRFPAALFAVSALLALAGCGNPNEPGPLFVNARSEGRTDLSRTTWASCTPPNPPVVGAQSRLSRLFFAAKGSVSLTETDYVGLGCTGQAFAPTAILSGIAEAVGGDRSVTFVPETPPGVAPTVNASGVRLDLGVALGLDCYWVDDTVSPRALYAGASGSQVDVNGFPTQLSSIALLEQPQ